jgi:tetratricopeptide (TPR) repeat protein
VAAHEVLEQMIALGYVERPSENREIAIARTVRELRYNLGEAYQDAARHGEAYEIFRALHEAEPDDERFTVRLFASCQALGKQEEMQQIADRLAMAGSPVAGYLRAQLLIVRNQHEEALEVLLGLPEAQRSRPPLLLQTADLYLRLGHFTDARDSYQSVLNLDPDQARAHLGLGRIALHRRKFPAAAQSALDALQIAYNDPAAHFLLGLALSGSGDHAGAIEALRAAIYLNPNFPEAHLRLAALLEKHQHDVEGAREHRLLARRMRRNKAPALPASPPGEAPKSFTGSRPAASRPVRTMPVAQSLIVVTGLPRSGTSMTMQMLAAGGLPVLSDGLREPDEDNPRGYLEFEPVKALLRDSAWLRSAKGKAVKIVLPLLTALPADLPCHVILCRRDLDEVIDSQDRMLARRGIKPASRRGAIREEYERALDRACKMLSSRPGTELLIVDHRKAITAPHRCPAEPVSRW